jgi:hypothetical protein
MFKNDLKIHFKSLHEIKLHLHLNIYFMYKINKMPGFIILILHTYIHIFFKTGWLVTDQLLSVGFTPLWLTQEGFDNRIAFKSMKNGY